MVKIVFGAGGAGRITPEVLNEWLSTFEKYSVKEIDTANIYQGSEVALGKAGAAKKFIISTKAPGMKLGIMKKQNVIDGMNKSLKDLDTDIVDIYYLHGPDPGTPIEETLSAIQQIYAEGKFKRFGVSNYSASEVQKIYDIQKAANSVLPSVYQGNYNAVARHSEAALIPLLRILKISYYVYSPIAGGFLVKSSSTLRSKTDTGRFATDSMIGIMYNSMYTKESMLQALDEWENIAKDAGVSKAVLAYRWVVYHSVVKEEYGDAVIIGGSKVEQFKETLEALKNGPLDEGIARRVEEVWGLVKKDAPVDNYESWLKENAMVESS